MKFAKKKTVVGLGGRTSHEILQLPLRGGYGNRDRKNNERQVLQDQGNQRII